MLDVDLTLEPGGAALVTGGARGIGRALYARLFDELHGEDIHMAVAGITLPNAASMP